MSQTTDQTRTGLTTPAAAFGREDELQALDALFGRGAERGGALVIHGDPGIGKSFLLTAARERAVVRVMRVLTTAGVECEAHLPFAGLHQLLLPILSGLPTLPRPQRDALQSAFGVIEPDAPALFLIALATLTLLGENAHQSPLLVIVENAQWLDRATADALAFVGRRLDSDPIVMLLAIRGGAESPFETAGLPHLELEGLGDEAASALLEAQAPGLKPLVRDRLLAAAEGNPLALVELPRALGREQLAGTAGLPDELPLTARLEQAFVARAAELPAPTRMLLLVAALNDSDAISEALEAATLLGGDNVTLEALAPAASADLLEVTQSSLRFRHPLVRSAIRQGASVSRRQAGYAALAKVVAADPDRRAWHQAAACVGPDEDLALELETVASRARRRGSLVAAVAALERAAELSQDQARRASRLLGAAELALELGRSDIVTRIVHDVEQLQLDLRDSGRLALIREMVAFGIRGDPAAVLNLVEVANRMGDAGDSELALNLLLVAATSVFWTDRDNGVRGVLLHACERLAVEQDNPRLLSTLAHAAPIERAAFVIDRAANSAPDKSADPDAMHLLGLALGTVGAQVRSEGYLTAAAERMREEGRLRPLAQVLGLRAWAEFLLGRWPAAMADAEESVRLSDATGQPVWKAAGSCAQAMLAGARGDAEGAWRYAAEAEQIALPLGVPAALTFVQMARGLTALSSGRHDDAYDELRRLFDPADPAHHSADFAWAIGQLAEAAVYSDHRDEARELLRSVERLTAQTAAPWPHVARRHARALLADDDHAENLFQAGLRADLSEWPFDRARLQLAYGVWLRRQRRATDSRAPLRAARDAFDALGAAPWAERARQELRASGERSRRRDADARDELSPQELQIAQMAAAGLSNRDIGQSLFLSHRTVGSHLYRIFPKLGVTSRTELRQALDATVSRPADR